MLTAAISCASERLGRQAESCKRLLDGGRAEAMILGWLARASAGRVGASGGLASHAGRHRRTEEGEA